MKKVLVITQNFPPEIGSAANRMKQICIHLSKQFDLHVLTTEPQYPLREIYQGNEFQEDLKIDATIQRVKARTGRFEKHMLFRFFLYAEVLIKLIFQLLKDKEKYDVVFVTSPPLSIPLVGLFAKFRYKAKFIVDIRDLWPETLKAMKGRAPFFLMKLALPIERHIYKRADTIIVNSEGFMPYIQAITGMQKKIVFLPNGLTEAELQETKREKNEDITIIYAGNMGLAQDIYHLVNLAERFKEQQQIKFRLIGYGIKYQEIKQQIRDKNLTNIDVSPPEPRAHVLRHLQKADIAYLGLDAHPVFGSVLPGKVIDYMGMGLPIIGFARGYSKEIITKAGAGIIIDSGDMDQLADELQELAVNKEKREAIGISGRQYANQHYNWHKNFAALKQIINEDENHDA